MIKILRAKIFIISFLSLIGCNTPENVRSARWKYIEGYHIGDLLNFQDTHHHKLSDDYQIFVHDSLVATLIKANKKKIMIRSRAGELGMYSFFDNKVK